MAEQSRRSAGYSEHADAAQRIPVHRDERRGGCLRKWALCRTHAARAHASTAYGHTASSASAATIGANFTYGAAKRAKRLFFPSEYGVCTGLAVSSVYSAAHHTPVVSVGSANLAPARAQAQPQLASSRPSGNSALFREIIPTHIF